VTFGGSKRYPKSKKTADYPSSKAKGRTLHTPHFVNFVVGLVLRVCNCLQLPEKTDHHITNFAFAAVIFFVFYKKLFNKGISQEHSSL